MKATSLTNKQVLLLVAENEKFVEKFVETEDNLEDKLEDNLSKTSGDENVFMEIEYDDDDNRRKKWPGSYEPNWMTGCLPRISLEFRGATLQLGYRTWCIT